ncbi:MAG: hypothetical protein K5696_05180 [Lachnospiraceae bacterium]|nr:hypothetical protein [Lachnospiraceae bacterium]
MIRLSDGKVAHIDTYYKNTDGTIYLEEEFIDLEDLFSAYGGSIEGLSAENIRIRKGADIMTEDERLAFVANRILNEHRAAFEELAR